MLLTSCLFSDLELTLRIFAARVRVIASKMQILAEERREKKTLYRYFCWALNSSRRPPCKGFTTYYFISLSLRPGNQLCLRLHPKMQAFLNNNKTKRLGNLKSKRWELLKENSSKWWVHACVASPLDMWLWGQLACSLVTKGWSIHWVLWVASHHAVSLILHSPLGSEFLLIFDKSTSYWIIRSYVPWGQCWHMGPHTSGPRN